MAARNCVFSPVYPVMRLPTAVPRFAQSSLRSDRQPEATSRERRQPREHKAAQPPGQENMAAHPVNAAAPTNKPIPMDDQSLLQEVESQHVAAQELFAAADYPAAVATWKAALATARMVRDEPSGHLARWSWRCFKRTTIQNDREVPPSFDALSGTGRADAPGGAAGARGRAGLRAGPRRRVCAGTESGAEQARS